MKFINKLNLSFRTHKKEWFKKNKLEIFGTKLRLQPIGILTQNNWTVSASGWTKNQTTATIGLTGSSITFSGGSTATTANYAQWNGLISGSCKSEFEIDYIYTTGGSGLFLELKSQYVLGTNQNGIRYYMDMAGSKSAVIFVYNGVSAVTTSVAMPVGFTLVSGDTIRMKLSLDNYTVTINTYVVGREAYTSTTSYTASYAGYPAGVELNNHYKLRIGTFGGGVHTVTNWKFTLNDKQRITNLFIVDSLGRGLGASAKEKAYPFLINAANSKTFEVNGGPSDRMNLFLPYLTEILAYKATNVFNCMGFNDYRTGGVAATVVTNATTIKNAVEAAGSNFYQVGVIPNSLVDPAPMNTAFQTAFGSKFIDIYPSLVGTGYNMNTAYAVTGDPVPHLNDAGHEVIKNIILPYAQ